MDLKALLESNLSNEDIFKNIENMHSFDIAEAMSDLKDDALLRMKEILPHDLLLDVLAYLEPTQAAFILQAHTIDEQVLVVQNLEPDDAADILNEFEDEEKQELLDILDEKEAVLSLMAYADETAGSYMTNDILTVLSDEDVKTATKKLIKKAADLRSIKTIFVVDDAGVYLGQVTLKSLVRAKMPLTVSDIIDTEPTLNVMDDVDIIVKHIKHYGAYDIAVTDEHQKLLGAITTDDILDIYRDEALEDIEKLSMLPDTDLKMGVFKSALHRLPWLVILMVLSMPLALITSNYEAILTSVVVLAFFQPLMLDAGGDVASQTLAVTLVGFTTKEGVDFEDGFKEILSGTISGFVMGLLAFGATYLLSFVMKIDDPFIVGLVVSLSLWLTVILAPVFAFMIPSILKKLNFDPAVASGPFITTIIDITSIVIYFGLATLFLGGTF